MSEITRPSFPKDHKDREPEEPCEYSLWIDIPRDYRIYRWTEAGAVNTRVRVPILWGGCILKAYLQSDYFGLPRPSYQDIVPILHMDLAAEVDIKPLLIIDQTVGPFIMPKLTVKKFHIIMLTSVMIKFKCSSMCQLLGLELNDSGVNGEVSIASSNFWSSDWTDTFPFQTNWMSAERMTQYESPGGGPTEFIIEREESVQSLGERLEFRLEFVPDSKTIKLVLAVQYTKPNLQESTTGILSQVPVHFSNGLDIWHKERDRTPYHQRLTAFIVPVPTLIAYPSKRYQDLLTGLTRNEYQNLMESCFGWNPTTAPRSSCECCECEREVAHCHCTCPCCFY